MNKIDMIEYIRNHFGSWGDVFMWYQDNQTRVMNGWYVCFDGPSINEMYLENVDPRSDESGDIITRYDVYGDNQ